MRLSTVTAAVSLLDPTLDQPSAAPPPRRRAAGLDQPRRAEGVAPLAAVRASPPADPTSLAGLADCVDEARAAALVPGDGPPDPPAYASLRARLEQASAGLPAAYRQAVADPLLRELDRLGARGYARLLAEDPAREGDARLLLDVAQAVLQHGEGYQAGATAAFQEVVTDLYASFLSAEARRGVKAPEVGLAPPLVRWGSAESGPYTWPATATASLGVGAAVVSLPAANASAGLLAWPALAHEAAGHDILAADEGLEDELAAAVRDQLLAERMAPAVAGYWADRIDETAADVLGVLNMGPAAAVGLIGYFRGLNDAWGGTPTLRGVGPAEDPHPADLARAYLAAETVRLLSFDGAGAWADRLVAEADRDLGRIQLGDVAVTAGVAKASAAAVARAIVRTRLHSLEGRSLGQIQDWRNQDEALVVGLRRELHAGGAGGRAGGSSGAALAGADAAHAVAAGIYEAVSGAEPPSQVLGRMIAMLDRMSARDPAWAPPRFAQRDAVGMAGGARVA